MTWGLNTLKESSKVFEDNVSKFMNQQGRFIFLLVIFFLLTHPSYASVTLNIFAGSGTAKLSELTANQTAETSSDYGAYPLGARASWHKYFSSDPEAIWRIELSTGYHQWLLSKTTLEKNTYGAYSAVSLGLGFDRKIGAQTRITFGLEYLGANSLNITTKTTTTVNNNEFTHSLLMKYEGDPGTTFRLGWTYEDDSRDIKSLVGLSMVLLQQKFKTRQTDVETTDSGIGPSKITTAQGEFNLLIPGICLEFGFII